MLVIISNICVPICNRFHMRQANSGKITSFLSRLAVDMKFPIHIHIHIHRFSVDIHGYIHGYPYPQTPNLRTCSPQFLQNTAVQERLSPPRKT